MKTPKQTTKKPEKPQKPEHEIPVEEAPVEIEPPKESEHDAGSQNEIIAPDGEPERKKEPAPLFLIL